MRSTKKFFNYIEIMLPHWVGMKHDVCCAKNNIFNYETVYSRPV
jgi:hypothetical protein